MFAGIVLTLAILIGGSLIGYRSVQRTIEHGRLVAHTDSVIFELEVLIGLMKDAESGHRGYIITHQPEFLDQYRSALGVLDEKVGALDRMIRDDLPQTQRFAAAKITIDQKLHWIDSTKSMVDTGAYAQATWLIQSGYGRRVMDRLREQITGMQAVERAVLAERAVKSAESFSTTIWTIAITAGTGIVIAFLLLFYSMLRLEQGQRQARVIDAQRESLRITLASIGDAVITTDELGRVNTLNAAAEHLTGWNTKEARSKPLVDIFRIVNEKTRKPVENPAMVALREGRVVGLANHTILIAKDGSEIHIDDSAAPIKNEAGVVSGCVLIFRDIGEQRKVARIIERSEARKTAMFETALDCIITMDHHGMVVEFNTAAENTFGHKREDVVGKELAEVIIPPQYRERYGKRMAHYLATGQGPVLNKRSELSALRADGTEFPCELTVTRVPVDGDPLFTAYLRDISERKQGEKALEEREWLLRTALEAAELGTWSLDIATDTFRTDDRHKVIFGTAVTGLTEKEAIGTIHPEDQERVQEAVTATLRTVDPVPYSIEYRVVHADNSVHWVHAKGSATYVNLGPEKKLTRFAGTVADITERVERDADLKRTQERLRFVMDTMPQKVITATPSGEIEYLSPEWMRFSGRTFEQLQDRANEPLMHPADLQKVEERWMHSLATGEPYEDEYRVRRADGAYRWHLIRMLPMRDAQGAVQLWVGAATDIHDQWESAELLRQYAADLSESDRRKNEFLAMLAHELRNPLAPICNAIELMDMDGNDETTRRSISRMMQRQVGQMVRLVDDLLDVSRVSSGKIALRKERVDLAQVVQHAVEAARPHMEAMGQQLVVELPGAPLQVDGDPARLAQVVANLLNNASKFSGRDSRVELKAVVQVEHFVITVKDEGVGLSADELPRIFDLFVQADTSLERSTSGLGIGLTLVKNLVQLHGGTVVAESEGLGKGSTFTLRIPVLAVHKSSPLPEPVAGNGKAQSRKVLVVDDNRDAADSLSMILTKQGHTVRCAFDGLQAIVTAGTFLPDVMLLDIGLPNLNGYEVARKLRLEKWGKAIYMVALTGWGQDEHRARSAEAGFDKHLVKPVDMDELKKVLAERV